MDGCLLATGCRGSPAWPAGRAANVREASWGGAGRPGQSRILGPGSRVQAAPPDSHDCMVNVCVSLGRKPGPWIPVPPLDGPCFWGQGGAGPARPTGGGGGPAVQLNSAMDGANPCVSDWTGGYCLYGRAAAVLRERRPGGRDGRAGRPGGMGGALRRFRGAMDGRGGWVLVAMDGPDGGWPLSRLSGEPWTARNAQQDVAAPVCPGRRRRRLASESARAGGQSRRGFPVHQDTEPSEADKGPNPGGDETNQKGGQGRSRGGLRVAARAGPGRRAGAAPPLPPAPRMPAGGCEAEGAPADGRAALRPGRRPARSDADFGGATPVLTRPGACARRILGTDTRQRSRRSLIAMRQISDKDVGEA